jgi:hypothetical protein
MIRVFAALISVAGIVAAVIIKSCLRGSLVLYRENFYF